MSVRRVSAEKMDEPGVEIRDLADSLADLRSVNRWLGSAATMIRRLGPLILRLANRSDRPVRLLDVGTGSADLPLRLVAWSRKHGVDLRVVACDRHPTTAALAIRATAGQSAVRVVLADALALPFGDDAFDLGLCSTTLHHFPDASAVRVLRELDRVSRTGVLVSDLRRTPAAALGARLLAATVWRGNPVTRHDGPLSVAAAFTPDELIRLAHDAGIPDAVVRREPVFRLSLLVDRT